MMSTPTEEEILAAGQVFMVDHDRLRSELLSNLPEQLTVRDSRSHVRRAWLVVAASVCAAAMLLIWLSSIGIAPRTAYALEGVHERLLKIRSLHVQGRIFTLVSDQEAPNKEKVLEHPLEWYAERPSRYWHTKIGTTTDSEGVRVERGYVAADGGRTIFTSDNTKTVFLGETDSLATDVQVEWFLQGVWGRQLVVGPASTYREIGREKVDGLDSIKYERWNSHPGGRLRHLLWLNPTNGLPVRSAVFSNDAEGREQPLLLYERIEVDVPPAPKMFSQEVPEGYTVTKPEKKGASPDYDPFIIGSAGSGGKGRRDRVEVRHGFAMDNRAILVSWQHNAEQTEPEEDEPAPLLVTAGSSEPEEKRDWELHPLVKQSIRGKTWEWTLVIPAIGVHWTQPIRCSSISRFRTVRK